MRAPCTLLSVLLIFVVLSCAISALPVLSPVVRRRGSSKSSSSSGKKATGAVAAAGGALAAGRLGKKKKPKLGGGGEEGQEEEENTFDCFPASATAIVDGRAVKLGDLRVGDRVQTGVQRSSNIFMFTHAVQHGVFEFVRLETDAGALTASSGHFVHTQRGTFPASEVVIGDFLRVVDGTFAHVQGVRLVREDGLYNPQTLDGDIVIDGFVVSTYTKAVPIEAAVPLLTPMRVAYATMGVDISGGLLAGDGQVRRALLNMLVAARHAATMSQSA